MSSKWFLPRKQKNYRAMRQVRKQDFLFVYDAMLVRSVLFPSPMKNLFHSLVFKIILAIINIRTLQFCWLKREMNATSPGSLHIWYHDREKKFDKILLQKFHTNGIISIQARIYQSYKTVSLFSIFPCTIIIASCVHLNLNLACLFFHKFSAKKDSVQQHDPFSFLSELKNGYSNQHPSYEISKPDKRFKTKENTTQYEQFYGY